MQSYLQVQIHRLPHAVALGTPLPAYQSEHAAGMDLHAAVERAVTIAPGEVVKIPTGCALAIPEGHEAQVRPRSGLSSKHRILLPNAPGTIDADYRGEVLVALLNAGDEPFVVEPNARIAQLVVVPIPRIVWDPVDALPESVRGCGGFGSSGA